MELYDDRGRQVVMSNPACDWLTATTFNPAIHDQVEAYLIDKYGISQETVKVGKTYIGLQYGYVKLVTGSQKRQAHYLIECSGASAEQLFRDLLDVLGAETMAELTFTRIDVQYTLAVEHGPFWLDYPAETLKRYKSLISGANKPKVYIKSSSTGTTLYIGSSSSDRMFRIYEKALRTMKEGDGPIIYGERIEVQLRREYAKKYAARAISGKKGYSMDGAITHFRSIYDRIAPEIRKLFYTGQVTLDDLPPMDVLSPERRVTNRERWIKTIRHALIDACMESGDSGINNMRVMFTALISGLEQSKIASLDGWKIINPDGVLYNVAELLYSDLQAVREANNTDD